jgi:HEPN domain-containing protein
MRRSHDDLRAAEVDLATQPALISDAAFHCQQAAEKALKAFLTWHDVPFRSTHDLAELGRQCSALDASLEPICRRAEILTAYAWVFRYPGNPGDPDEPTWDEVDTALAIAGDLAEEVRALLRSP